MNTPKRQSLPYFYLYFMFWLIGLGCVLYQLHRAETDQLPTPPKLPTAASTQTGHLDSFTHVTFKQSNRDPFRPESKQEATVPNHKDQ